MNLDFTQARDGEWQWHHLGHMHVHVYFTCKRIFRNTSWVITADTTHTHPFNSPLSGTTRVSQYQKGKTNLDFTEARDIE